MRYTDRLAQLVAELEDTWDRLEALGATVDRSRLTVRARDASPTHDVRHPGDDHDDHTSRAWHLRRLHAAETERLRVLSSPEAAIV